MTLTTPPYGSFIIPCVVLAVTYLTKKNEVSSFTRSKVTKGVPKFKKVGHVTVTTPPFDPKMLNFYRISYGHPTQ